ncbi:hypothetical protein K2X89_14360, partial [Myxococcota bacterium]|nr:hypothetical protein [Myxococcota bacterium]
SPEGEVAKTTPRRAAMPEARRRALVVGLFDNRKANSALLLDEIAAPLVERLGARIVRYSKPNASHPAEVELLDRMAREVGLVLAASSD